MRYLCVGLTALQKALQKASSKLKPNAPGYNISSSQVDTDCEEPPNSDDHDSADESSGSDDDDAESARGDDIHSEDNYSVG